MRERRGIILRIRERRVGSENERVSADILTNDVDRRRCAGLWTRDTYLARKNECAFGADDESSPSREVFISAR
jgi:hypothetical protein